MISASEQDKFSWCFEAERMCLSCIFFYGRYLRHLQELHFYTTIPGHGWHVGIRMKSSRSSPSLSLVNSFHWSSALFVEQKNNSWCSSLTFNITRRAFHFFLNRMSVAFYASRFRGSASKLKLVEADHHCGVAMFLKSWARKHIHVFGLFTQFTLF